MSAIQELVGQDGDDIDDDETLTGIGFMFDAMHSRIQKVVPVSADPPISITLSLIGEDPGHVQSGQYLWPAALFAARHLVQNWGTLHRNTILEFGAGCGLAGLTAAMLPSVSIVNLTDYDPGCLSILANNLELNRSNIDSGIAVGIHAFQWGKEGLEFMVPDGYGLIIGTDLLYCVEVVRPLLYSVASMMNKETGLFVLVASFDVGDDIRQEVKARCEEFRLSVEEIVGLDLHAHEKTCQVQYFRLSDNS